MSSESQSSLLGGDDDEEASSAFQSRKSGKGLPSAAQKVPLNLLHPNDLSE